METGRARARGRCARVCLFHKLVATALSQVSGTDDFSVKIEEDEGDRLRAKCAHVFFLMKYDCRRLSSQGNNVLPLERTRLKGAELTWQLKH